MSNADATTERDDARSLRVGRILNTYLDARARGQAASEETLFAQHPDLADELRQHLELLGELQPTGDKIEALITQGLLTRSDDARCLAELGAYKILGYVGRGGMGIVLKAYEESLNRTVALKILRPELADDRVALERFTREAKAAAALRHPNIVTVHAVGQERGTHFIAMEYVAGPSLAEVILQSYQPVAADGPSTERNRALSASEGTGDEPCNEATRQPGRKPAAQPPPFGIPHSAIRNPEVVRDLFHQLLSALAAAHDAGLIHRDVKSSNILLDGWPRENVGKWERTASASGDEPSHLPTFPRSHAAPQSPIPNRQSQIAEPRTLNPEPSASVKLADFGLARMITAQTRVTLGDSILGTPEYMSPEQARGDEHLDHPTDLYSAGVVLYEMLTGRTPFRAHTPSAVIHQILNVPPPEPRTFNQDVDPALASLSLRLMAKEPDDRLASAQEALMALDGGRRVTLPQQRRRARSRLAGVGLAGAALIVSIGLLWHFLLRMPVITEVQIGPDERTLQYLYAGDLKAVPVYRFPQDVKTISDHALLDINGSGRQTVVVGLEKPFQDGSNVIGFDARGGILWSLALANHYAGMRWPDCGEPSYWYCRNLTVANLDGQPGDELAAVTHDERGYPTRLTIVDPQTKSVLSTFWHMGQLEKPLIIPDFFGRGQPAIVGWGTSNKLDGFDDEGNDNALTCYDQVPVVMILDPSNMNGIGPLMTERQEFVTLPRAQPYAYACLDLASSIAVGRLEEGSTERRPVGLSEVASISGVRFLAHTVNYADGPYIKVSFERSDRSDGVSFELNRYLEVQNSEPHDGEDCGREFWNSRWKLIIQDHE